MNSETRFGHPHKPQETCTICQPERTSVMDTEGMKGHQGCGVKIMTVAGESELRCNLPKGHDGKHLCQFFETGQSGQSASQHIERKHFVCRGCTEPITFVNGVWRHVFPNFNCLPVQPPLCLIPSSDAEPHAICEKPMLHDGFHMASEGGGITTEWPQYFDQKKVITRKHDLSDPTAVINGMPVDMEPPE